MYHVMSAFCPILPSDCFSTIALNNPREGEAVATKKIPNCSIKLKLNSWRRKLSALPMAGPCPEDMVGHGRTWLDMVGHDSTWQDMADNKKKMKKKVNEACSPFGKHLNWVIKGILHTSANSRVYLWKIWKLHRGTSKATYFSDFFSFAIWFSAQSSVAKSSENTQVNIVDGQLTYFPGILLIVRGRLGLLPHPRL